MQDGSKAVWSIPYVSVACFPSLKHNFIAYRSSKVSDCIFEIHQQWQSGFSRVYSNCCCSCSFEPEIIKIGQSSHKMYSNKILIFQESTTILNACPKKSGNLLNTPHTYANHSIQIQHTYANPGRLCRFGYERFINYWLRFFDTRRGTQFLKVFVKHSMLTILCWPHPQRAAHLVMFKLSIHLPRSRPEKLNLPPPQR